jgi:hypothetical protein
MSSSTQLGVSFDLNARVCGLVLINRTYSFVVG